MWKPGDIARFQRSQTTGEMLSLEICAVFSFGYSLDEAYQLSRRESHIVSTLEMTSRQSMDTNSVDGTPKAKEEARDCQNNMQSFAPHEWSGTKKISQ